MHFGHCGWVLPFSSTPLPGSCFPAVPPALPALPVVVTVSTARWASSLHQHVVNPIYYFTSCLIGSLFEIPCVRKINSWCQRFMSKEETEKSCNFIWTKREAMGHFPLGSPELLEDEASFLSQFPSISLSRSPLAQILERCRLPNHLIQTHLFFVSLFFSSKSRN